MVTENSEASSCGLDARLLSSPSCSLSVKAWWFLPCAKKVPPCGEASLVFGSTACCCYLLLLIRRLLAVFGHVDPIKLAKFTPPPAAFGFPLPACTNFGEVERGLISKVLPCCSVVGSPSQSLIPEKAEMLLLIANAELVAVKAYTRPPLLCCFVPADASVPRPSRRCGGSIAA